MQEKLITPTFAVAGTLAATTFCYQTTYAATLLEVSANSPTATHTGTMKVGNTTNDAAYLASFAIGANNAPAVKKGSDMVGGQVIQIPANTKILITLAPGATAPSNVCVVLSLLTG